MNKSNKHIKTANFPGDQKEFVSLCQSKLTEEQYCHPKEKKEKRYQASRSRYNVKIQEKNVKLSCQNVKRSS